jgi:hypothetical protein
MKHFKEFIGDITSLSGESALFKAIEEETGYRLTPIDVFSPDGLEEAPQGSFYSKGEWSNLVRINEKSFTGSKIDGTEVLLPEGYSPEQFGLSKYRGGIIVFSTDVNAVKNSADTKIGKLKNFVENKFDTFKNRVLKNKKLTKLIQKHNLASPEDYFIGSFSIGKFFNGRYVGIKGEVYNEKSSSIEILGVPSEVLLLLATEIAKDFKQETVLVKDLNKNKFYLADARSVDDVSKEVSKIKNV